MKTSTMATIAAAAFVLAGCVSEKKYDALEAQYAQMNQSLSGEVASGNVKITRLQGAIKVSVNSELLFPSGGWNMPPAAAATIAKMAPILAPNLQSKISVNGYTDNVPIGPELKAQGVPTNQVLSMKRAQTVVDNLIANGVSPGMLTANGLGDTDPVASNDTAAGRAQNRRVELTLASTGG